MSWTAGQGKAGFFLLCLALAGAVITAYSPVFRAGYTNWDDPAYTFENRSVQGVSPANLKAIFTDFGMANYNPLTGLSFAVENAVFGERALTHHAVNLILHALNAALVFALLSLLFAKKRLAFAAALIWALHPANVESAAWIAERKNLLYAFFYLAALIAYWRHLEARGRKYYFFALGLFILALGSKAAAVTLPLALLLIEAFRGAPGPAAAAKRTAPFFAAALLFTALAVMAQSSGGRILTARGPALLSFYLLKAVLPCGLSAVYPYEEMLSAFKAGALLYLLPALTFIAVFWAACRNNRPAAWGLAFFAVHILPFISLIPVGGIIAADRYLYLPAIGLIWALLSIAQAALPSSPPARNLAFAAVAALALIAGTATLERTKVWTSSLTLWTDTLDKFPDDRTANLNMAHALLEQGGRQRAAEHYLKVLRADPAHADALYNLGTLYGLTGRYKEALDLLGKAVSVNPKNELAWNSLGLVFQGQKLHKDAQKAFKMATAANPSYAPAYANLAETEAALGDCRAARAHYSAALSLGFTPLEKAVGSCYNR
ncbi:MAG: tetratricopeptide repeat protein [Elusimicrobia bacterium]|nr:tetratricopeptide repeat protein [Elusimicrobiota bacterium]